MKEELKLIKQAIGTLQRAVAILEDRLPVETEVKQNGFRKPTISEARSHYRQVEHHFDFDQWYDHYQTNGWRVGGTPMKDWKASMRTWERKWKTDNPDRTVKRYDASGNELKTNGQGSLI